MKEAHLIHIVEVHPGFGVLSEKLGVVNQDLVVFNHGSKQEILVALQLIDAVSELVEIFLEGLKFLCSEEVKYPTED